MLIRRLAMPAAIALVSGVLAASLAGCAPTPAPVVTVTVTAGPATVAPSVTPTPSAVAVPNRFVISLTELDVVDSNGDVVTTASFGDGATIRTLMLTYLGTVPGSHSSEYETTEYSWGASNAVTLIVNDDDTYATVGFRVPSYKGFSLETDQGITVGASRSQVVAAGAFDDKYDFDGDGKSDYLGLDAVKANGNTSNAAGTPHDFIMVQFSGNKVTSLDSPSNNYGDV